MRQLVGPFGQGARHILDKALQSLAEGRNILTVHRVGDLCRISLRQLAGRLYPAPDGQTLCRRATLDGIVILRFMATNLALQFGG